MIKTLSIRNFKSFPKDRPVVIDLSVGNKSIALFYGLNGAGKSAIGEVVDRNGNIRDVIPDCIMETSGGLSYRYLVYNQSFVERAFRGADGFPGIFTIGEPQADALRRREAIEADLPPIDAELKHLGIEKDALSGQTTQATETLAVAIWKSFQALKNSPLREYLKYGNDRSGFVEKVRATQLTGNNPVSLDELTRRRQELGDGQAKPKKVIRLDTEELCRLEADPIWSTPIEGSGDSRLASLIDRLKNQDWVRHGSTYLDAADGHCPFCQQDLPPDFENDLHALFDVTYQQKMVYVHSVASQYEAAVDRFGNALDDIFNSETFAAENAPLQSAARGLRIALGQNTNTVRSKLAAPSSIALFTPTAELCDALADALRAVNEHITTYNGRIERHKEELGYIETDLWLRLAHDAAPAIAMFTDAETPRQTRRGEISARRRELGEQKHLLQTELTSLHTGTASIEEAVAAINSRLTFLGMDGFSIQKDPQRDHLYQLARPGQERGEFISLSEGEKTLITFLYFIELVKGSSEATAALPPKRTIVVVDDPISSLSHNHVYDVATLIARDLAPLTEQNPDGVRQLIVLTHSLFFFHELTHGSHQLRKHMLFKRVVKQNETDVVDMKMEDLGNDYEAFWRVIKDAQGGAVRPATLANAMRCVLERFFYFVSESEKCDAALAGLARDNPGFRSFARYLDRGSHADRTNIAEFADYDANVCLAHFKEVFDQTGHGRHYERMMRAPDE
jgi:wobble nucleotide-excising tRNase